MANLKSSKKAIRVSKRKRVINIARKTKIELAVKSVKKGIVAKAEKNILMENMSKLQSELDKAVKKGFMPKNKANRLKTKFVKASKANISK